MPSTRLAVPATLPLLLVATAALCQSYYKTVDPEGHVSYSDEPTEGGVNQTIEVAPGPSEEQVRQAQQRGQAFQESVDRMVEARQRDEALQLEKRRLQEQARRDQEIDERLARLEELETRDRYRYWGAYYPGRPRPPYWRDRPDHHNRPTAHPLPGLPPVTGLDGSPLFDSRTSRRR